MVYRKMLQLLCKIPFTLANATERAAGAMGNIKFILNGSQFWGEPSFDMSANNIYIKPLDRIEVNTSKRNSQLDFFFLRDFL